MKQKITIALAAVILQAAGIQLKAQQAIGLGAGNHNASYSAFVNPANAYPDKNRVYLNFWGAQMGFTNNFLSYEAPFGLYRFIKGNWPAAHQTPGGANDFNQDWVKFSGTNKNKLYYLNKVYGPSAFFRVSNQVAIGFGLNGVSGFSADGLSREAAYLLRYGLDTAKFGNSGAPFINTQYNNGPFSVNSDRYQEWFFSLAGVTSKKGPNVIKWGGTGKILLGMGGAGVRADALDFKITSANALEFNATNAAYFHTDDESAMRSLAHPLGLKFDIPQGAGVGADVGFVYEYRPEPDYSKHAEAKNWWGCYEDRNTDYSVKFGAAITDLGFVAYSGTKKVLNNSATKTWNINTTVLGNNQFQNQSFSNVDQGFFNDSAVNAGENDQYVVTTPVAFQSQLDFRIASNFYMGINWQQNLKSKSSMGLKNSSYLSFVPRFETEHGEIGLPVTLTRDYSDLNIGLYGRLGPVIVGTDDLAGLAGYSAGKASGNASLYFGVRLQLPVCGYEEYREQKFDTTVLDTSEVFHRDSFWKTDTVYLEKTVKDTIRIMQTDTVIEYLNREVNPDLDKKAEELTRKQAELKKREDELKEREKALDDKEKLTVMSSDCSDKIKELEDQLKRERDLYVKLNSQYQDCKDDRERIRINMENLQRELDLLRNENAAIKIESNNRQNEIIRLQNEIKRLKSTNSPCSSQVKSLDSLLVLEQGKNSQLENDKSRQSAEITGLKRDSEAQKKRIADLEKELSDLKSLYTTELEKNRILEEKLKTCGNSDEAAKLKAELEAQKKKCDDLEYKVRQLEAENGKLTGENSNLTFKVSGTQKELDDLRTEYEFELAKNKKLEEQLKNCGSSDEAAKLKTELEAQKKRCDELDAKLKALEADKGKLQTENSTISAKVSGLEKELAESKGKLDVATAKIAYLEEQLKKCGESGDGAALKAQIEELKKQNSAKDAEIAVLKKDKSALESDLTSAKARISALEKELSDCSGKDCKECEDKLAEIKAKYDNQTAQYNALYEEYQAMNDERNKLKAKIADLENQLKSCSGSSEENSKLQAEISKLKNTIIELNGELSGKQKSLDDLQTEYDKVVGEKATLQKQITSLQAQVKLLQQQVTDLQEQLKKCQEGSSPGGE